MKSLKNLFKKDDDSLNIQAIATSISMLVASIVLINNLSRDLIGIEQHLFFPAFIVFLGDRIGILLDNINTSNSIIRSQREINESIRTASSELKSDFRNSIGVVQFESIDDAVSSIYADIGSASHVTNIFIGDRDQSTSLGRFKYQSEKLYNRFLRGKNSVEWRDVVGISEIYAPRYSKLKVGDAGSKVTIKILRHSPPLINFVIIRHPEKNGVKNFQEVYFGWIGGPGASETYFYSSDEKLVALFIEEERSLSLLYGWTPEQYDAQVIAGGEQSKVDVVSGIDLVDKAGWWATNLRENGQVVRMGIFQIVFEGSGCRVKGRIFDASAQPLNSINHTKAISHYKDRIHFEYVEENSIDGRISGTCGYKFHFVGDQPSISGYVTRDGDSIKRDINGYKITDGNFPLHSDDLDGMQKLINSEKAKLSSYNGHQVP